MAELYSKDAAKRDVKNLPFDWLSLKISQKVGSTPSPDKASVFIAVPKKIVALSTQRNRIKRLIREAVRLETAFKDKGRNYYFRVLRRPDVKALDLKTVAAALHHLKKENGLS